MVSTHSKRRGKEGASEGASLKQVSLRSTRIDGFIIAFTKIFAVSPNKNSTLVKSEEHAGMHPKHHLPLQVCILAHPSSTVVPAASPHTPHSHRWQSGSTWNIQHSWRIPQRQARGSSCLQSFTQGTCCTALSF